MSAIGAVKRSILRKFKIISTHSLFFFFFLLLLVGPFIFAFGSLSKTSLKTFLYQMEAEISLNSS